MTLLLLAHFVAAAVAPGLAKLIHRRSFLVLALVPGATFAWLLAQTSHVTAGKVITENVAWVPTLEMDFTLQLGTLQWLLGLLVSGVGALALLYCTWYFKHDDPSLWRFTGVFTAFAGAMFGLVVADNLLALYIFWELTTVFSYTLIGHNPVRSANRRSATQALLVTTFGGLAMLVGTVILGETSSYTISEMLADPPPAGALTTIAVTLVLLGALTKSAQLPFHFWLPGAMAAPTPVSAYLHAASMVKAGIYLILLLAPAFATTPGWRPLTIGLGIGTMILGGWRALRQDDIKLLLAFGTVSQLGMMTALAGVGSKAAAMATLALVMSHALFKSTLFFTVGIIDKGTGTRDLTQLHGLGRRMPLLAAAATIAAASMAGVPPLVGFVAKESALAAAVESLHAPLGTAGGLFLVIGLGLGSALTAAYSIRFVWGAFVTKKTTGGSPSPTPFAAPKPLLIAPVVLAAVTLVEGFLGGPLTESFAPYASTLPGSAPEDLALWHGFTPALGLSALAIGGGAILFWWRVPVARLQAAVPPMVNAERVYQRFMRALDRFAVEVTALSQGGSLPTYLSTIFLVVILLPGAVAASALPGSSVRLWDMPSQAAVGLFVIAAAILAVRGRNRLQSVMFVGLTGYGLALLFHMHGAPDLALTQILVETFSLVLFVLVLRKFPLDFRRRPLSRSRYGRLALAGGIGFAVTAPDGRRRQCPPRDPDLDRLPQGGLRLRARSQCRQRDPRRHPRLGHPRGDQRPPRRGDRHRQPDLPAHPGGRALLDPSREPRRQDHLVAAQGAPLGHPRDRHPAGLPRDDRPVAVPALRRPQPARRWLRRRPGARSGAARALPGRRRLRARSGRTGQCGCDPRRRARRLGRLRARPAGLRRQRAPVRGLRLPPPDLGRCAPRDRPLLRRGGLSHRHRPGPRRRPLPRSRDRQAHRRGPDRRMSNAISPSLTLIIVAGFLVSTGVYLLLERALPRVLLGIVRASNGVATIYLVVSGPATGRPSSAPALPRP